VKTEGRTTNIKGPLLHEVMAYFTKVWMFPLRLLYVKIIHLCLVVGTLLLIVLMVLGAPYWVDYWLSRGMIRSEVAGHFLVLFIVTLLGGIFVLPRVPWTLVAVESADCWYSKRHAVVLPALASLMGIYGGFCGYVTVTLISLILILCAGYDTRVYRRCTVRLVKPSSRLWRFLLEPTFGMWRPSGEIWKVPRGWISSPNDLAEVIGGVTVYTARSWVPIAVFQCFLRRELLYPFIRIVGVRFESGESTLSSIEKLVIENARPWSIGMTDGDISALTSTASRDILILSSDRLECLRNSSKSQSELFNPVLSDKLQLILAKVSVLCQESF